jgi:hypothetical protein
MVYPLYDSYTYIECDAKAERERALAGRGRIDSAWRVEDLNEKSGCRICWSECMLRWVRIFLQYHKHISFDNFY